MQGEQLKLNLDYLMMQQHLSAVHDEDDEGYIALCKSDGDGAFNQHHYLYADLIRELEFLGIDEQNNYYFSANTFYIPKRLVENVRQIRAMYADIDCHHLSPSQIKRVVKDVIAFLDLCTKGNIPAPSFLVLTGRGLQLYWLIEHLPKHGVPLWQMVQDAITERLTELLMPLNVTVDNVSDIARILRLSGTINTKSNTMATLVMGNSGKYRLDDVIANYFPQLNPLSNPEKKNASQDGKKGKIQHIFNLYSLHYARLMDLITLLELRKGDIKSDPCRRRMVFLYRYWGCCYHKNPAEALEAALEFNQRFTHPLPEKTVKSATRSAEKAYEKWLSGETTIYNGQAKRLGYNYRNSTLINWLGITPEEQRELQTIIGKEEKYRRNNDKRTGRDETGLTAKQRARQERDKRILEMHEQGLNNCEIGRNIGVDEKTVRRVLIRGRHF